MLMNCLVLIRLVSMPGQGSVQKTQEAMERDPAKK